MNTARSGALTATLETAGTWWETLYASLSRLVGAVDRRVEVVREGTSHVLVVHGALDKHIVLAFKARAKEIVQGEGQRWSIDLSRVQEWDSVGLAALVYALDVSELSNKPLELIDPCPRLRHTLQRSQLHHLFPIVHRDELAA